MKRLFEVNGSYFDNKYDAKVYRDALNGHQKDDAYYEDKVKNPQFKVKLGPDHWKYAKG